MVTTNECDAQLTFIEWMATSGRAPVDIAYRAGISVATVYRARLGRPVTFSVARKLVSVTDGAVALEGLLAGLGPAGAASGG